ncbi:hypothetical protein [Flavobacterium sp.]|uniref:hypothetical protein n=1 Tax=Flavobacterium sp. TaxID=239 RepID=UPI0037534FAF
MKSIVLRSLSVVTLLFLFSSCSVIEGIFKAGVGVGVFIVIAVVALILFVISRFTKKG